jgi:hypothetical protein
VAEWARPTRAERYDARLSKTTDELDEFYDAVAPRAEEAIATSTRTISTRCPDDAAALQRCCTR